MQNNICIHMDVLFFCMTYRDLTQSNSSIDRCIPIRAQLRRYLGAWKSTPHGEFHELWPCFCLELQWLCWNRTLIRSRLPPFALIERFSIKMKLGLFKYSSTVGAKRPWRNQWILKVVSNYFWNLFPIDFATFLQVGFCNVIPGSANLASWVRYHQSPNQT